MYNTLAKPFISLSSPKIGIQKTQKNSVYYIYTTWHQEREVLKTSHSDKMQFRSFQKVGSSPPESTILGSFSQVFYVRKLVQFFGISKIGQVRHQSDL